MTIGQGHTRADWESHHLFSDQPAEPGEFLYHFTALGAMTAMALSGELWITSPERANDPKEQFGRAPFFTQKTVEKGNQLDGTSWQASARTDYQRLQRSFRTCCFSIDDHQEPPGIDMSSRFDRKAIASAPMWQHYGDSHRGVCLILDRLPVEDAVKARFGEAGEISNVKYESGLSSEYLEGQHIELSQAGQVMSDIAKNLRNSLRCKNGHWSYERECRIIIQIGDDENDAPAYLPLTDLVVGVVVGYHFDRNHLETFSKACSALGVDLANTASMSLSDTGVLVPWPLLLPNGLHKLTDEELRSPVRKFLDDQPEFFYETE